MKRHEYVNVHIGKFCGAKSEEHRGIIDEYAAKGYRYVGYIPTNISDYGKSSQTPRTAVPDLPCKTCKTTLDGNR